MIKTLKIAGLLCGRVLYVLMAAFYLCFALGGHTQALTNKDIGDILNGNVYYDSSDDTALCGSGAGIKSDGLSPGSSIYLLGDSIFAAAKTDLTDAITDADLAVASINADGGRAISTDTSPPGTSGLDAIAQDSIVPEGQTHSMIGGASVAVVELGTNSGTEDLDVQIPTLVNALRQAKPGIPIFWVNLFYKSGSGPSSRNAIISAHAAADQSNYSIIDTTGANIELGNDNTHPTAEGSKIFAKTVVDQLQAIAATAGSGSTPNGTTVGNVSKDGNPFHILTYPPIVDEVGAASAIDAYIQNGWPTSPFVGLGKAFVEGGKQFNVNPFLAVGHLQRENGFATASSGWHTTTPASNNAFGRSASQSQPHTIYHGATKDRLVYQWPSWEASLNGDDNWFSYIRRAYLNPGSPYESPDFETYLSHYAPNSDGNNEAAYVAGLFATIDALSGQTTSGAVTVLGNLCESGSTQPAIPGTGVAAEYIPDCAANNGNAAIACTAINQLMGVKYSAALRASPTDPTPQYLDCSALTSMALYRTFGTDIGGICSTDYLTNKNFERIDVHDILPGDFIGKGTGCATGGGGGHIALVVSYDKTTKKLITVEASSEKYLSGLRGIGGPGGYNVGLAADGLGSFAWAVRYTGPKTLQAEATRNLTGPQ
jgi:lysophospholipase L1-like esterase